MVQTCFTLLHRIGWRRGGRFELYGAPFTDPRNGRPSMSFGMAVRGMPHHPIKIGPRAFFSSVPGIGQVANFGEFFATVVHELGHSLLNLSDVYSVDFLGNPIPGGLSAQRWEATQMSIILRGVR